MITKVLMPKLGETMETGVVGKWHKKVGDKIEKGEVIFEVTTDKANFEVEALKAGFLLKILYNEGDTVEVIKPVAYTADSMNETAPKEEERTVQAKPAEEAVSSVKTEKPAIEKGDRVFATPLAKRLAKEKGIDLSTIKGSGPNGRILERDLAGGAPSAQTEEQSEVKSVGGVKVTKLSPVRKIIADRLSKSKMEAPHFYVQMDFDVTKLAAAREEWELDNIKISINDMMIYFCAKSIKKYPKFNSHFVNGEIRQFDDVNIGFAVAMPDGLVVPVIKNVDKKTIKQVSEEAKVLVKKAKDNKLTPDDMSGGTFTISNMGMLKVDSFTAIINPPQVGILAVSRAKPTPIVSDYNIVIRDIMKVTLSSDHRVIDGAYAAGFLYDLKRKMKLKSADLEVK